METKRGSGPGRQGRQGKRRQFTDEFKAGAVRLVLDEGRTVAQVARELDLTPSALGGRVKQARADRSKGNFETTFQNWTNGPNVARLTSDWRESNDRRR